MLPPDSAFSNFLSFLASSPDGREAYEERPSALRFMAMAARREDAAAFDALLVEHIAADAGEVLVYCGVSDAPAVTAALRARLLDATGPNRARIAALLGARGYRDEARSLLLDMLAGAEAYHAVDPLRGLVGPEALEPVLAALANAKGDPIGALTGEGVRRSLRDLALHLAGLSIHRSVQWGLTDAADGVRAWAIGALRGAVADRAAGRPWLDDDIPASPAFDALLAALREPGAALEVRGLEGPVRLLAAGVLIAWHRDGDPRALPALRATGGALAAAFLDGA